MKAIAYYFTGTGNTERVLQKLKTEWEKRGHTLDMVRIFKDNNVLDYDPLDYDRIIIGYPVHGFNAPTPIFEFIKKLPFLNKDSKKSVFLLRTSGEPVKMNHSSRVMVANKLKKHGFEVVGEFAYVMPYNIIFRHPDGMVARMENDANIKCVYDCDALERGFGWIPKVNWLYKATNFLFRIEHPGMPLIGMGFKVNKKKCIGCGLCVKKCPRNNIVMKNGIPKFGKHCVGCMACAFFCPKDAIRTSLLNLWRVNKPYTFKGESVSDNDVIRYCRKAYLRYFHEIEDMSSETELMDNEKDQINEEMDENDVKTVENTSVSVPEVQNVEVTSTSTEVKVEESTEDSEVKTENLE